MNLCLCCEFKRVVYSYAVNNDDSYVILLRLYPCTPCAEDLAVDLPNHPPQVQNSKQFSEWMCRLHNRNNEF